MGSDQLIEKYLSEAERFRLQVARQEKILLILSFLRLINFIFGIILIWFGFRESMIAGILLALSVFALFLYLLKLYSEHSEKKVFLGNLVIINSNEADAISGDLSAFNPGSHYDDPHHDFSNDVDLFGDDSLFRYLNRTISGYGRDILAGWLLNPYPLASELLPRQEAVRELASKPEWMHKFMASGMTGKMEEKDITGLIRWMDEAAVIRSSGLKKFMISILPVLAVASLIMVATGILHYLVFTSVFLLNLACVTVGLRKTNRIHNNLTGIHIYLSSIHRLLKVFDGEEFNSQILGDVSRNISGEKVSAAVAVKQLGSLIQAFDARLNVLVGFILNGLLLWDYHSIYRLERWKSEYRKFFPGWLEMLGKTDALISFGNYAFNNPGFVYPELSERDFLFSFSAAGHPLIGEKNRICNDLKFDHQGMVFIISGANMAGKSTFLRTVAVNYILAMSGAPVCAKEMHFTPLKLFTSMRTTDSLSKNESYFYAELRRLKFLKSYILNAEPVLFILDEILKGTNSADKSLGSRLFLKKLVELGGTGMIATHDTSLGEMENEYPGVVINKCFEVEIDGEVIKFDYKLRDGITHKMNAAFLMKQMGILE